MGGHVGAHKGWVHIIVTFVGKKKLMAWQYSYSDVHGCYMAQIEQNFAHLWHLGLVCRLIFLIEGFCRDGKCGAEVEDSCTKVACRVHARRTLPLAHAVLGRGGQRRVNTEASVCSTIASVSSLQWLLSTPVHSLCLFLCTYSTLALPRVQTARQYALTGPGPTQPVPRQQSARTRRSVPAGNPDRSVLGQHILSIQPNAKSMCKGPGCRVVQGCRGCPTYRARRGTAYFTA